MTYLKQCNFNEPWDGTQRHYECKRMEADYIALRNIPNPADYGTNQKGTVSLKKHE